MFNLSFGELFVLGSIALIFIGPKQLPQVAKVLGKTLNELRKAMSEVKSTMADEMTKPAPEKVPGKPLDKAPDNLEDTKKLT